MLLGLVQPLCYSFDRLRMQLKARAQCIKPIAKKLVLSLAPYLPKNVFPELSLI